MDYFISCSLFEGFCLPIAEAMTLKKPVISYDLDEIRYEFQDTIEYVHTKEEMKARIITILQKNDYSKDIKAAKLYIEKNYSPEVVAARLMKIIAP